MGFSEVFPEMRQQLTHSKGQGGMTSWDKKRRKLSRWRQQITSGEKGRDHRLAVEVAGGKVVQANRVCGLLWHCRSGIRLAFFEDRSVSFLENGWVGWGLQGGASVRMTRPTANKKKDFCGNAGERWCDYEVRQNRPVQGMKEVESAGWVTAWSDMR